MSGRSTSIRKIGNGTFIPVTQEELRALGMRAGQEVSLRAAEGKLVVTPADGDYERTRRAAARMRGRYRETLAILAK